MENKTRLTAQVLILALALAASAQKASAIDEKKAWILGGMAAFGFGGLSVTSSLMGGEAAPILSTMGGAFAITLIIPAADAGIFDKENIPTAADLLEIARTGVIPPPYVQYFELLRSENPQSPEMTDAGWAWYLIAYLQARSEEK